MNTPQDPNQKKGLSGLAIAGIGCGSLLLLAFLGGGLLLAKGCSKFKEFAADPAAAVVWAMEQNPDIEVIKKDDAKREITYKTKSTGEVTTISYEDIKQGKLTLKNDKGEEYGFDASKAQTEGVVIKGPDGKTIVAGNVSATAPPAEVPLYPGLETEDGGGYRVDEDKSTLGMTVGNAKGTLTEVKDFYESKLKAEGYELQTTVNGDNESATLVGTKNDRKTSISVAIVPNTEKPGMMQITVQYNIPKP
ncbi:MAG: hypothetical protein OJI67_14415 [Prosthecobacter sp.]|nr:hypothetical protein [Prosthecobacter sp.]